MTSSSFRASCIAALRIYCCYHHVKLRHKIGGSVVGLLRVLDPLQKGNQMLLIILALPVIDAPRSMHHS